jgi:hypothetical protein
MWILCEVGCFSVVQKPADADSGSLTIRARVGADLDALRQRYLPELSPTQATPKADYEFRARAPQAAVSKALAAIANEIGYDNFKARVAEVQGEARELVYHRVWLALTGLNSRAVTDRLPVIHASIGHRRDIVDGEEDEHQ